MRILTYLIKFVILLCVPLAAVSEILPDFSNMKNVEPNGRVKTNGVKYYLIIAKDDNVTKIKKSFLEIPAPGEKYNYVSYQCLFKDDFGNKDSHLITALVFVDDNKQSWDDVKAAWYGYESIDPKKVLCTNDAWGL